MSKNNNDNLFNPNNNKKCQHGGPPEGGLDMIEKRPIVITIQTNIDQIHKALLFKATHQEILGAEQVVLEQLITKHFHDKIDITLMKMYFSMAATDLMKGQIEESKIKARVGIYLAMYIKHGRQLWDMLNAPYQIQMMTLREMHTAIGLTSTDHGLAKVLHQQIPCDCLLKALPNLNNNNSNTNNKNQKETTTTDGTTTSPANAVADKVLPNLKQRSGNISSA